MNKLPSPSVGVWEYGVGVWCGSVVWECWSVGVRVWKCGSGGAHPRQVCNYENINAQFLVIYIFINAHGHL